MRFLSLLPLLALVNAATITSDPTAVAGHTYTHIIVGGGTAGLTVASRLAEDSRFKVLVIETGPDEQNNTVINDPNMVTPAVIDFSYFYFTTPQEVNNQSLVIPQGRVLGGSSSINGMQWTRGSFDQYNTWEFLGNPGWNAASLFSYMKKAEHFNIPNAYQRALGATSIPAVHGFDGMVNVSYPIPYMATFSFASYITSVKTFFGVAQNPDICSGRPNGAARFFYSILPGPSPHITGRNRRCSSAVAYLYPFVNGPDAGEKPNLTVLVGALATKIVWGTAVGGLQVATGVNYAVAPTPPSTTIGTIYSVTASKEVIVSAGALGSPHFLELSGIGDPTVLAAASVPVVVNLPQVGTNLQDQPLITNIYTINPANPPRWTNTTNQVVEGSVAYLTLRNILGHARADAAVANLLATIHSRAEAIVTAGGHTSVTGLSKQFLRQAESMTGINATPVTEMSFAVSILPGIIENYDWNLMPQTRGTVHIISNNPAVLSAANPDYLGTEFDLLLSANATKLSRGLMSTPPVSHLIINETSPGLIAVPLDAPDSAWQAFVKSDVNPVIHPLGSVALGPRAEGGCVDPHLIVYGTKNVRVVDSSVIPVQLSAHTSQTVYGIAEKAADIIKAAF